MHLYRAVKITAKTPQVQLNLLKKGRTLTLEMCFGSPPPPFHQQEPAEMATAERGTGSECTSLKN